MTGKPKILIVENDTPLVMLMVSLLTRAGCDVVVANTGKKGMELARENRFDLIALETDLPDLNAFEIAYDLKKRHISRRTPIVFIGGRPPEEGQQRSQKLGSTDYVDKPFDVPKFTSLVLARVRKPAKEVSIDH
jgi:DNA-binding response OmpR family regulator